MTRILITGCRRTTARDLVLNEINDFLRSTDMNGAPVFVHGACPTGVDAIVEDWCVEWALHERYPAEDLRSKGTRDCIRKAVAAGIPTRIYPVK